nr:hypothetical protein [Tanacetum cinerariifolium]
MCIYALTVSIIEPKTVKEALTNPAWIESMQEELHQFIRLDVWELVPSPDGIKPLTLKWLFKNKHDEENTVIRNKTRLVMRGYRQEEGIDFEESFAPVARMEAIRIFLAYACQPEGFIIADHLSHVYKLKKALYGLKQVLRAWYDELSTFLLQNEFSKGIIDPTLFTRCFDDDILVVQVYVDDIIFGSTNPRYATLFSDLMKIRFEMSMMGEMTFFLSLQVNQFPGGIFINQSNYVNEILKKYGLNTCDTIGTPMDVKDKLDLDQIENGTIELYFVKTDYQLADIFTKALPVDIFNYLVRRLDTFKSTSDGAQFLGKNLVSWSSKKQDCTSLSTAKSEYVSLSACCAQVLWMWTQLTDYGYYFNMIPILCDSKSAIAISCNPRGVTPTNSSSLAKNIPITSQDVVELNSNAMVDGNMFVNPFANSSTSPTALSSSQNVDPSNMHMFYQPYPHEFQWTKDHHLEQVIGEPSRPVLTRNQLLSDGDMCMYALTVSTIEPKNVKEAMTDPAWIDSMQEELLQFKRLDVWVLVPAPDNISPLTLKWLFKNNYQDILAYAAHKSFTVFQMDVKTAFLHGSLKKDVYVCQPEGFINADHLSHVYKLKKALYGLKRAPRAWYDELSTFLLQNHFFKGTIDPTLFIRRFHDDILVVQVYVDDIIFGSTHPRPNIVHATCLCARYQAKPIEKHLKEVKRIFRYLWGTINTGLWYSKDSGFKLTDFQMLIMRDEHVEKGTIELYFVKMDYQLVDIFTKALPADRFNYLVRRLGGDEEAGGYRNYTDDEINRLARGGKQRGHIPGVGRFESGGASGSGGCVDDEKSADDQDDEDEDGDGDS